LRLSLSIPYRAFELRQHAIEYVAHIPSGIFVRHFSQLTDVTRISPGNSSTDHGGGSGENSLWLSAMPLLFEFLKVLVDAHAFQSRADHA
jgi:hypothetical protein